MILFLFLALNCGSPHKEHKIYFDHGIFFQKNNSYKYTVVVMSLLNLKKNKIIFFYVFYAKM